MKSKLCILFGLCLATAVAAQEYHIELWDNAAAPTSNELTEPERERRPGQVAFSQSAEMWIYRADPEKATGQAIVFCPGGGYQYLSMGNGHTTCKWLAENGITAAVLKYRIPNHHPEVPLDDVDKALKTVRAMAGELGIDPRKVGVGGGSSGGHLAAMAGTLLEEKPAFMVLFYPVVSSTPGIKDHETYENLVGVERIPQLADRYSPEKQADETACPAILFHSDDDDDTPAMNSVVLYNRLRELGIPASLHIYPSGGHGWGMGKRFRYHEHFKAATIDWLKSIAN